MNFIIKIKLNFLNQVKYLLIINLINNSFNNKDNTLMSIEFEFYNICDKKYLKIQYYLDLFNSFYQTIYIILLNLY